MITETGKNLSVLIATSPGRDWEAFATWYSFWKNLPDASVSLLVVRNGSTPFMMYQWAKRLNVRIETMNGPPESDDRPVHILSGAHKMVAKRQESTAVMIVDPLVVATDLLDGKTLTRLNESFTILDDHVWYMKNPDYRVMIDDWYLTGWRPTRAEESLVAEAKETREPACLVSYKKGCGRWIDTAVGCPFSSAGGLVADDMTANEHRVIELWKKMVTLYSAVI